MHYLQSAQLNASEEAIFGEIPTQMQWYHLLHFSQAIHFHADLWSQTDCSHLEPTKSIPCINL